MERSEPKHSAKRILNTTILNWPTKRKRETSCLNLQKYACSPRPVNTPHRLKMKRMPSTMKKPKVTLVECKAESSFVKREEFPNHLVDFLRKQLADQEYAEAVASSSQQTTSSREGFATPRSSYQELTAKRRESPTPVVRSSVRPLRPIFETPVSSARLRIQSPAPAQQQPVFHASTADETTRQA